MSKKTNKRTVTVDELIREMVDIMSHWDGEAVVEFYNAIVESETAIYKGDGLVEIKH